MPHLLTFFRAMFATTSPIRLAFVIPCGALALASILAISARGAAAAPQTTPAAPAASQPASPPPQPPSPASSQTAQSSQSPGITEDELRQMLVGKQLFLRGGYLDNDLSFNEHGVLISHSAQGSYTLCEIQIDKVHLEKHKVELEGERFGLHFLGALPSEDPTKAVDRVN
ncbi:MAG: hypothetical protein WBC92_19030, partial [Terracidiphilus sp.]